MPRLKGLPEDKSIPIIWGQQAGYLYLEFRDFQKGARKDDRMTPIAQSIAKEDALALAEYFAAKPWPNAGAPAASKADAESGDGGHQVGRLHQLPSAKSSRAIPPCPASPGSSATISSRR